MGTHHYLVCLNSSKHQPTQTQGGRFGLTKSFNIPIGPKEILLVPWIETHPADDTFTVPYSVLPN